MTEVKAWFSRAAAFARTAVKAAKFLITVRAALPRYVVALLAFGLLPLPGPADEVALVAAAAVLWFRHRPLLAACWRAAQLETRGGGMTERNLWSIRGPEHWTAGADVEVLLTDAEAGPFADAVRTVHPGADCVLVAWVAPWRAGEPGVRALPPAGTVMHFHVTDGKWWSSPATREPRCEICRERSPE
jgi:hypothetical protein